MINVGGYCSHPEEDGVSDQDRSIEGIENWSDPNNTLKVSPQDLPLYGMWDVREKEKSSMISLR